MSIDMPATQDGRELPSLTFRQEDLPEVKHWMVNNKYYVVLRVEMVGKKNTKYFGANNSGDEEKVEGTLQVLNVKALGDKLVDAKSLEREDLEQVVAQARNNKV